MAYTTIKKPSDYFNTKLYTGTGSSNAITGVGFQPDWTWIKDRDTASNHMVTDAVRGATKTLYTQNADGESTVAQALKSFNTDGFTVGTDGDVNANTKNFASWNWKAGTTSGFEILTWTGNQTNRTISHSLGKAPECLIIKGINQVEDWTTYQVGYGNTGNLILNSTGAASNSSTYWQDTTPSASVITLGTSTRLNGNSINYICYAFTGIQGYSKFGSYTGNGSTDGAFIYTGFKPAWVMIKRTDSSASWTLLDNKRDPYNVTEKRLFADSNDADTVGANGNTDFLSNGVKIRTSHLGINASGGTYIYMAFAEEPLVGDNPATAR